MNAKICKEKNRLSKNDKMVRTGNLRCFFVKGTVDLCRYNPCHQDKVGYIMLAVLGHYVRSLGLILFHVALLGTTSSGWARHFVSSGLVRHFVVHRVLFLVLCRVRLVLPAGFTHEPPGFWQHINSGF